jgi:hypothetical protein
VISVFDGNGRRVARSRAHAEMSVGLAAPSLQQLMAGGAAEGMGQTFSLEGDRIYTSFSRLKDSGWSVAPGLPAALVEGATYRSVAAYGAGVVLSLALAAAAAIWVARSINQPMHELHAAARALGRGSQVVAPTTSIQEIRDVADALTVAAAERRAGETQREELLHKEQEARENRRGGGPGQGSIPGRAVARASHAAERSVWVGANASGRPGARGGRPAGLDAIIRNANSQVQLIDDLLRRVTRHHGKMRLDGPPRRPPGRDRRGVRFGSPGRGGEEHPPAQGQRSARGARHRRSLPAPASRLEPAR